MCTDNDDDRRSPRGRHLDRLPARTRFNILCYNTIFVIIIIIVILWLVVVSVVDWPDRNNNTHIIILQDPRRLRRRRVASRWRKLLANSAQ